MPRKGDNFDSITSAAAIGHLANAVGYFTRSGIVHNSSKTVEIKIIFEKQYIQMGRIDGFMPTALGVTSDFADAKIDVGAQCTINGVDYEIKDRDSASSDDDVTTWVLQ